MSPTKENATLLATSLAALSGTAMERQPMQMIARLQSQMSVRIARSEVGVGFRLAMGPLVLGAGLSV